MAEDKPVKKASKKPATKKAAEKPTKKASAAPKETSQAAKRPAKQPSSKVARRPLAPQTFFAKPGEIPAEWILVDVTGQRLGRISTQIVTLLMGKHKPTYTRSSDTGDFVVVVNAEKVELTGNKWEQKVYQYHTQFPGGIKTHTAKEVREKHPERLIEKAVWRMLPKNKGHMVHKWFKKLKVYAGPDHPHKAQNPKPFQLTH